MKIHVYMPTYNEEKFLPYFLRHYSTFATEIHAIDNCSNDGTYDILKACPLVKSIESVYTEKEMREDFLLEIKNNAWKLSRGRADWVIVVDCDELLYHKNLPAYLKKCERDGVSIVWPVGYEMLSKFFPTTTGQVYDEVKFGAVTLHESKPVCFKPDVVEETLFLYGAHEFEPTKGGPKGKNIAFEVKRECILMHFKFLGYEYVSDIYHDRRSRLSTKDVVRKLSHHYFMDVKELIADFEKNAVCLFPENH